MNDEYYRLRARRLEEMVSRDYPVDFRPVEHIIGDMDAIRDVERYGQTLLSSIETRLMPAMKRLCWLGAATYINRTVSGSSDQPVLEVGTGDWGKYEFVVSPFCSVGVLAIFDVYITYANGTRARNAYGTHAQTIGGLAAGPEPAWYHVTDAAWRAAPMPHLVNFSGLSPLETVLDPLLDQVVKQAIDTHVEFRRRNGFPLTEADLRLWQQRKEAG